MMVGTDLFCLTGFWQSVRRGSGNAKRKKGNLFFVLFMLHVLGSVWTQPEQSSCPLPCECSEATRTVKCVNKNLSQVPQNLPSYARNLFITGNNITSLGDGAFRQSQPLTDLSSLNLSGNHLQELGSNAFGCLPNLTQVDLSNNELEMMSNLSFKEDGSGSSSLQVVNLSNSFKNESLIFMLASALRNGTLTNLIKLDLAGNDLLFLPKGIFSSLPNLKHLDLSNNSLMTLSANIFKDLSKLESLNLSNNSLKLLKNATFFDRLTQTGLSINLDNNSWVCDCLIEDFSNWLKETKTVNASHTLLCSYPENLRDKPVVELNILDFECQHPDDSSLQTSYVFLGIVLALIGVIFLLVLYLNRKGIKKWMYNIRDACRDHMEGYHYRYEINADPRLTNLSTNSDV